MQTHLGYHSTGKKHIGKEKFLKESKLAEICISQKFRLVNYNTEEKIQATESKKQRNPEVHSRQKVSCCGEHRLKRSVLLA